MVIPAKTEKSMTDLFVGEKANWEQRWPIHSESTACTVADVFTSEQDATLACAAPEMLEVCEEVMACKATTPYMKNLQEMATAAIKKAKGE